MKEKKYIVLGLTPQGLSVIRELGHSGCDVIAFGTSKHQVGYHSKYGKKVLYKDIPDLKAKIKAFLEGCTTKPICYVTSGEVLASILSEYTELYQQCEVYSSPYEVVETLAHKDKMYEIALNSGLHFAKYATLDKYRDGDLQYPLFIKRNYEIPLFFKALRVDSPEQLKYITDRLEHWQKEHVIVQELIDIPTDRLLNISCQGFFNQGKCQGMYVSSQIRRLKKGITSYIEEYTDTPVCDKIKKTSCAFMSQLKYNGFAEFEFMYDIQTEDCFFIEVNTRTCGLQSSMSHKFKNISTVLANPEQDIELEPKVEKLNWMNIMRDIRARFENRNFSHLFDIFRSKYDILQWDDPVPFFSQLFRL